MNAIDTVAEQVRAFNAGDLDDFVATYADDCVITGVTPDAIVGAESLRAFYAPRLATSTLSCRVESTVTFGDRFVVLREFVVGPDSSTETIATFDVTEGRIRRAAMVKADPLPL